MSFPPSLLSNASTDLHSLSQAPCKPIPHLATFARKCTGAPHASSTRESALLCPPPFLALTRLLRRSWELSDTISETTADDTDFSNPTGASTTFTAAKGPKTADGEKAAKGVADLQASLPFLFEPDVNPFADNNKAASDKDAKVASGEGKGESTLEKGRRHAAVFRGKFWASMRRKDGKRMAMFGPERVVEDPYIKVSPQLGLGAPFSLLCSTLTFFSTVHPQQANAGEWNRHSVLPRNPLTADSSSTSQEILIVGTVATFVFLCIVLAIRESSCPPPPYPILADLPPPTHLTPTQRRAAERTPLR